MKFYILLLITTLFFLTYSLQTAHAKRKILEKPKIKIEVKPRGPERIGWHPKTGKPIYLPDRKPRVEFDKKSDKYKFTWIGYDKKIKTVMWEPATKIDIIIIADVKYNSSTQKYKYEYQIFNTRTSKQAVKGFMVEYETGVENATSPDREWWSDFIPKGPIGKEQWKLKTEYAWRWADVDEKREGIMPGTLQKGFSFESKGLPGIVNCYAEGHTKEVIWPEEPPSEIDETIPAFLDNSVKGKTVGPVNPPEKFEPIEFLNYITRLIDESFSEGWIEDKKVKEEIKIKINKIKEKIKQEQKLEATNLISSLLEYIEKQNNKTLLSEAYTLLKYNLRYFIENF